MGAEKIMGQYNAKIKEELDRQFREEVFKRYGMKKGVLVQALEDAMKLWITQQKSVEQTKRNDGGSEIK